MNEPVLTPSDRCDRCGAQAFVLVTVAGTDLLFCGHHYAKHDLALRDCTAVSYVSDERDRINARPSPSS